MGVAFNKFQHAALNLGKGNFNFSSDTLKVFLSNTAPTSTHSVYSDESGNEIASGNGYTTGGTAVGSVTWTDSGGTATLAGANVVFTWTGAVGPFRYALIYDSTTTYLLGWWDYGSSISGSNGTTFTVNLASNILTET